eukprot:TRINITY_DN39562_c0_g1_i1.p1 TRINITY_DN39562_c0_g1~~TRINITY_DN39562_c0_g1_i1.p1  ORF type:complete len:235 (-),score=54.89 TRINITY_DN39562_c0_g1_i1:81-725(-)
MTSAAAAAALALLASTAFVARAKVSDETLARHVRCDVCKIAVMVAERDVKGNNLTDIQFKDLAEYMCDANETEGRWIPSVDILRREKSGQLYAILRSNLGDCRNECRVVQRACRDAIGDQREQLTAMLEKHETLESMTEELCASECERKKTKSPKGWKDEAWTALDEDGINEYTSKCRQREMDRNIERLKGMPGMAALPEMYESMKRQHGDSDL